MKDWLATIVRGIIGCFALSIILEDMLIGEVVCDRCGETCGDGFEERHHGPVDPQTGCQDVEIVCAACLDEQASAGDDEADAADERFTQEFEEGE